MRYVDRASARYLTDLIPFGDLYVTDQYVVSGHFTLEHINRLARYNGGAGKNDRVRPAGCP